MTADERIPLLLESPAAVRWVSYEPALGPVYFRNERSVGCDYDWMTGENYVRCPEGTPIDCDDGPSIDWIVVGGESGPGARPFNVEWVRDVLRQREGTETKVFVKQMGAKVIDRNDMFGGDCGLPDQWDLTENQHIRVEHDLHGTRDGYQGAPVRVHLQDRKGGDMNEWPEYLRVREWPS